MPLAFNPSIPVAIPAYQKTHQGELETLKAHVDILKAELRVSREDAAYYQARLEDALKTPEETRNADHR